MKKRSAANYFNEVAEKYDAAVSAYEWNGCETLINQVSACSEVPSNATVLDFGSGTGLLSEGLKKSFPGIDVTGVDVSEKMLEEQRKKDKDAKCVLYDGKKIPFDPNTFDLTVSAGTLEFISTPKKAVKELVKVTKPGGVIAVSYLSEIKNGSLKGWWRTTKERIFRVPFFAHGQKKIAKAFSKAGCKVLNQKQECGLSYPDGRKYFYNTVVVKKL